ncbi:hypothetical protein DBR32_00915 [Taibaiella sp. KBW10]|uniref:hypothetical protein n=1 Tax=Taibaiella sp. KBW10 TaxID=2153357 RepID=UPI000F594CD9|nr:hypothetical protein [Taibaiella sp. KBW10]RQO32206.1 hypothetical protein DBR32_00915 [Taibaiella sp. KBW10]
MFKICLCFSLFSFSLKGQGNEASKYQFSRDEFKRHYKRTEYPRFTGLIQEVDATTIRFDDKVLTIRIDDINKQIFLKGIFYPNVFKGEETIVAKTDKELATMSENEQIFHNGLRNDSLTIGAFDALEDLNPDYKTKRYRFWLFGKGIMNPTECYFELYNKDATPEYEDKEFINGAVLTFFRRGTLII